MINSICTGSCRIRISDNIWIRLSVYLLRLQQLESANLPVLEHRRRIGQQRQRDRGRHRRALLIRRSEKLTAQMPRPALRSSLTPSRRRLGFPKRLRRLWPSRETRWTRRCEDERSHIEIYLSYLCWKPSRRQNLGGGTIFRWHLFASREPRSPGFPSVENTV